MLSSSLGWLSKGFDPLCVTMELVKAPLLNPNFVLGMVEVALLGSLESYSTSLLG
jgi:hypothetical protein